MTQNATAREFASLLPTDADISAFLDGVEAVIISSRATLFDYNGTLPQAVPAIGVQFYVPANDKQPNVQHYTVGKPEHRVPSEDGTRFKVFSGKSGLPKDSKGLKLVTSIVNSGFPLDKLTDDVTVFEGMVVKLRTEAAPKDNPNDKDKTDVLVGEIVKLPWENKDFDKQKAAFAKAGKSSPGTKAAAPAASGTAAPAAAPATPAAPANALQDQGAIAAATEAIVTLLADEKNGGSIDKAKLGPMSFKLLAQNANRLGATKLLSQLASEFLPTIVDTPVMRGEELVGSVAFDGAKVTLKPLE